MNIKRKLFRNIDDRSEYAEVFYWKCPKCRKEFQGLYKAQIEYLAKQHMWKHEKEAKHGEEKRSNK